MWCNVLCYVFGLYDDVITCTNGGPLYNSECDYTTILQMFINMQ